MGPWTAPSVPEGAGGLERSTSDRETESTGARGGTARGVGSLLFPSGVRLWHFVVLPPVLMAMLVAMARFVDPGTRASLSPAGYNVYSAVRGSAISLVMAALIAYLAFRHRREYEAKLHEHNRASSRRATS